MTLENSSSLDAQEQLLPQFPAMMALDNDHVSRRHRLCCISFRVLLGSCMAFLRPSFLGKTAPMSDTSEKPVLRSKAKHPTEYLDGVRGVASLIVFILHWSHRFYPSVNSGWGYKDNTSFCLLPFVRLIYSGAAMVSIFFVVSGFVLSHRFIQRMHRREYLELSSTLTSITFRRAIRLFLPAFASSSVAFVCACLGIVSVPEKIHRKPFHHGWSAYLDYLDMESNPWTWDLDFSGFYNPQLWSIAVEFRGSMVVFVMIVGLAKTRTLVRIMVEGLLMVHCFVHSRWDVALFIAGVSLAELEVLLEKPKNPLRRKMVDICLVTTLVLGVFLSGYPRDHSTQTPGYMWSQHIWPYSAYRRRFWLAVSAILIMGPMAFLPSVQAVFLARPARYLGRISFALYLVHGLGNRTVGLALIRCCWEYIGNEGFWPYTTSFVVTTVLYFPVIIWASDVFWRGVDVPSNMFARWLEMRCAARA